MKKFTNVLHKIVGILVKNDAKVKIYANIAYDNLFVCFGSLLWSVGQFIYFMLLVDFISIKKCVTKKFI